MMLRNLKGFGRYNTRWFKQSFRGKKILEQLSKSRLFTEFENRALFFPAEKSPRFSNSVKKRGFENCSIIFLHRDWKSDVKK